MASPTAGEIAIVLGSNGRTIVNGFTFDELRGANGINLAANEIAFLVGTQQQVPTVPEPTSLLLLGSGLIAAGARRWRSLRKGAVTRSGRRPPGGEVLRPNQDLATREDKY